MAIVINGSGTVTGISVGGLPDDIIDAGTLADNAVGLAQMASGTDGNIITYDASGNPAVVSTGSSGQVLTSAGAGAPPTMSAAAGGGKILQVVTEADAGGSSQNGTFAMTDTHLEATITPTATSSKILIFNEIELYASAPSGQEVQIGLSLNRAISGGATTRLGEDVASNSRAINADEVNEFASRETFNFVDSPNTTSAITYTLQIRGSGHTNCVWGWQGAEDTMIILEVDGS